MHPKLADTHVYVCESGPEWVLIILPDNTEPEMRMTYGGHPYIRDIERSVRVRRSIIEKHGDTLSLLEAPETHGETQ